jgi:rubrerythrin
VSARGFRWALQTLRSDLAFERRAVKLYGTFSRRLEDPVLREMMREFTRAESGHSKSLAEMIARVESAGFAAVFFCPVCGWELDLGPDPDDGASLACPMCAATFVLRLHDGDYSLTRTDRQPA